MPTEEEEVEESTETEEEQQDESNQESDTEESGEGESEAEEETEQEASEEQEEGAEGEQEEEQEVDQAADSGLGSRIERLEQSTLDLKTENAYLRGLLSKQPAAAETETEVDVDDDPEKFAKELEDAPAKTILKMLEKRDQRIIKTVRQELRGELTAKDTVVSDRTGALTKYPDLKSNKEFESRATALYNRLTNHGKNYFPGALTLAAGNAFAELIQEGKMTVKQRVKVKEAVKKGMKKPLINSDQTARTNGNGNGLDMFAGFTKQEAESIRRNAKRLGVPIKDFIRNYKEAQKENAEYGRRTA